MKDYQIINGDCVRELQDLTRRNMRASLIHADPPYNLGLDYGTTCNDRRSKKEFIVWCEQWIGECYINLQDHGSLWLLINHENAARVELALEKTGFTIINWVTWYETFGVNCVFRFTRSSRRLFHAVKDKDNYIFNREPVTRPSARQEIYNDKRANPDGRLWDDVWGVSPPIYRLCGTHAERIEGFPTQLPLSLLRPIVACASNPGDLIVDCFNGSGTTGVAAIEFRRRYIGIDISEEYVIKSRERLEKVIEFQL